MCARSDESGKASGTVAKIVGKAKKATYAPFQVRLVRLEAESEGYCAGTIISERFVLTASHCLNKKFDQVVIFGSLDWCTVMKAVRKNPKKGKWKNAVLAEKQYPHPEYVGGVNGNKNDIGIIKLSQGLDFVKGKVLPACLPPRSGCLFIKLIPN